MSRYFVHKVVLLYKMLESEKGDNATAYLQNFAHNIYTKYNDPSSSVSSRYFVQGVIGLQCKSQKCDMA